MSERATVNDVLAKQIDVDAQRESLDDPPGWQQICRGRLRQITQEGVIRRAMMPTQKCSW